MKKHSFIFILSLLIATNMFASEGALVGEFSVSSSLKVHFSQGNLQYQASTGTWRFAEHQYDTIGLDNIYVSSTYDGWIDLFGYGTGNTPTKTSTKESDYSAYEDWGNNKISNGGNVNALWRCLTYDEWMVMVSNHYLGSIRVYKNNDKVPSNMLFWGYVFQPDDWNVPLGISDIQDVTLSEWETLEESGVVLFTPTGLRNGVNFPMDLKDNGFYWLQNNIYLHLNSSSYPNPQSGSGSLSCGMSVRLVQDKGIYDTKIVISTSAINGSVTGGGTYDKNSSVILTATPSDCYAFTQWSDGNTDNPRTITVTEDITYTAEFTKINYTIKGQNASSAGGSVQVVNP